MRCITGYLQPTGGVVETVVAPAPEVAPAPGRTKARARHALYSAPAPTAMMFADDRNLLPQLTGEQNILLALAPTELGLERRLEAVASALQRVGLEEARYRVPAQLSAGQRRRLSLAQCLVRNPECLALDEPTSSLDTATKFNIVALVQRLHQERAFTALVVTHDIDAALLLADDLIFFRDGRICDSLVINAPRPRRAVDLDNRELALARSRLLAFFDEEVRA
jgi:ABC-type nitrate/sulfonate/bicarbonate transport system ATPase subunit